MTKKLLRKKGGSLNTANNNTNRNSLFKSNNVVDKKSNMPMIIGISLLVIIIVVVVVVLIRYVKNNNLRVKFSSDFPFLLFKTDNNVTTKQMMPYIHDATIDKRFNYGSVPESSEGNEYNINIWLYVNEYKYRKDEDKCILYKGEKVDELVNASIEGEEEYDKNQNRKCNPGIWLLKNVNTLRIIVGLDTSYESSCSPVSSCGEEIEISNCDIKHFPLQKWVNLNVSLRNNVLDIFMNGTLHKSCILSGSPNVNKGDINMCQSGGFNGYLSNFKYSNKALSVNEIESIYKDGPTLKL